MSKKVDERKMHVDRLALITDYQKIFGSPEGKKILLDLCKRFWMLKTTAQTTDTNSTYFAEGQRSVILWILNDRLKINVKDLHELLFKGE